MKRNYMDELVRRARINRKWQERKQYRADRDKQYKFEVKQNDIEREQDHDKPVKTINLSREWHESGHSASDFF